MINLKGTERIFRRVELQRLEKERNDLVTEHIELMDVLREMTEEIKDLQAEIWSESGPYGSDRTHTPPESIPYGLGCLWNASRILKSP